MLGGLSTGQLGAYVAAQLVGGGLGCVVANLMFSQPPVAWSATHRGGGGVRRAEVIATLGLLPVVLGVVRSGRTTAVAPAVGAYIGSAHFFTSSTSFANPAVTAGRTLTDTLTGIAPSDAPAFAACQALGGLAGVALVRALHPDVATVAPAVVVPTLSEQESSDG